MFIVGGTKINQRYVCLTFVSLNSFIPGYCMFDLPGIFMIFDATCPIEYFLGYPS